MEENKLVPVISYVIAARNLPLGSFNALDVNDARNVTRRVTETPQSVNSSVLRTLLVSETFRNVTKC